MTEFALKQLGASESERDVIREMFKDNGLFPDVSYMAKERPVYFENSNPNALEITISGGYAVEPQSALGTRGIDDLAVGTGNFVGQVSEQIEKRPFLKYGLEVLDVAAAPVAYAARKLVDGTYIGNKVEEAKQYLFDKASGIFTNASYDQKTAQKGGVGVFSVLSLGVTGAKGLLTSLRKLKIGDHKAHHQSKVDDVKNDLKSKGYKVDESETTFKSATSNKRAKPDVGATSPDGTRTHPEVKTGNADLSDNQAEIYPQIRDGSAIPVGKKAGDNGYIPGVPLKDQGYPNGIDVPIHKFPGAK
jgi:hypothetical protein